VRAGPDIANPRSRHPLATLFRLAFWLAAVGTLAGIAAAGLAYVLLARDLPPIPPFGAIRFDTVSRVRAAHGQVLAEMFAERRYLVPGDRIPRLLVDAVLSSEDERFFEHSGTDLRGIARAALTNLRAGRVREGASTITQQLARTLLLNQERRMARKVREAILARRLEDIYSKDQILTLYLNLIFLGNGAHGVQAASRVYFGKELDELTPAEAATIAVLPQSPGSVTPVSKPDVVRQRRDHVLRRMHGRGLLDDDGLEAALATPVRTVPGHDNLAERAPIPATEAMKEAGPLARRLSDQPLLAGEGGVTVTTTIDLGLQMAAQQAARESAARLARRQGYPGPVAHLIASRWDAFARRNAAWLKAATVEDLAFDRPVLALATRVDADGADLVLTPDISGRLPLAQMRWATPYTRFPPDVRDTDALRTSLDGRLKDATQALASGDVILVRRVDPAAPVPGERRRRGAPAPAPAAAPSVPVFALDVFPGPQAALASVEPRSGRLVALVGGTDFDVSQVNRTESVRQTGSAIKPLYYARAYEAGIAPSTVLAGTPYREGAWAPVGDDETADMTLYEALTKSENRVSLRVFRAVLDAVGIEGLNDWLHRLGWRRDLQGYTPEALGADATPMEMLRAFATFANRGIGVAPHVVREIRDDAGRLVVDRRSPRDPSVPPMDAVARELALPGEDAARAITAQSAYLIAHNLRNVAEEGTGRTTRALGRPVCGKTGTLPFDVWFLGWTNELATVSWVGQDRRERWLGRSKSRGRVFGADTALPAWMDFMTVATAGLPVVDGLQDVPEGVVIVDIDPATGLLAAADGIPMPHLAGTEPLQAAAVAGAVPGDAEAAAF
jgi:penicillin-binding protein 1A